MRATACLLVMISGTMLTPATYALGFPVAVLPEVVGVRVGFDGHYKVGVWTPVEVRLGRGGVQQLESCEVTVTVPDCEGVPSRVGTRFPGSRTATASALLYARFGRVDGKLTVEVRSRGEPIDQRVFEPDKSAGFLSAIPATRKVVLIIGSDPLGVKEAMKLTPQPPEQRPVAIRLDDVRQLPERWYGYESIDALVISTSGANSEEDLKLSAGQTAALGEWIEMGGRLVLCVGSNAEKILAEDSPLGQFAPGRFVKMVSLRQTGSLETFAHSSLPIPRPAGAAVLRVPRLAGVQGVVEAREADLPMVVRTGRGFGQIVFLAADPDRSPLQDWDNRPMLWTRLLDLPRAGRDVTGDGSAMMHYGYNDVSGQLRSALDRYTGVRKVPFWLVALLIVVYIALIGPLDYFFLRRFAGRMQWTWVTFPGIVLVFCLAAWLLAHHLKGDRIRVNQAEVVDVEVMSGRVRGTSWANVFSPAADTFHLSLRAEQPDAHVLFSWLGLPGEALGGMNPRAPARVRRQEPYDFSPQLAAIEGVPIRTWSTRSFTARWNARTDLSLDSELVDGGHGPEGIITSKLPFPLSNCWLVYDRWVFELDTLEPGEKVEVGPMLRQKELQTLFTRLRTVADESKQDHRLHVPRILRTMMFYQAAGGRLHTGLANGYQAFVDFSDLLKTGRAVLVGRAPPGEHGAELLSHGRALADQNDPHVTVYRFVLPVGKLPDEN